MIIFQATDMSIFPSTLLDRVSSCWIAGLAKHDRFVALADQAAVSAANLLTMIIIGRTCSQDELGLYAAGFSLVLLAYSAQKAMIITPYRVLNPRLQGNEHRIYLGSTLIHHFGLSILVVSSLVIAGSALTMIGENRQLGTLLYVLAAASPFIFLREYARQISYAELQFRQAFFVDVFVTVVQLSGILFLGLRGQLNAKSAFMIIGAACCLASAGWLFSRWSFFQVWSSEVRPDLARNWFFGKWLLGSGLLREASASLYPWIIITTHGAGEAGIWASAASVVALSNPVMLALYNETAPRIAHDFSSGSVEALRHSIRRSIRTCVTAAFPFVIVLFAFGTPLLRIMYGPEYESGGPAVKFLILGTLLYAAGFAIPQGLLALSRPGIDFAGNAAQFIALLTIGLWAVQAYGATGAAVGVFAATLTAVVVKFLGLRLALVSADSRATR